MRMVIIWTAVLQDRQHLIIAEQFELYTSRTHAAYDIATANVHNNVR